MVDWAELTQIASARKNKTSFLNKKKKINTPRKSSALILYNSKLIQMRHVEIVMAKI